MGIQVRNWPILGVQGLDLAYFQGSGAGFGPFWRLMGCIWPIFGAILGVQVLDLVHFGHSGTGFGPLGVQGVDLAHFGHSGTGFGPFFGVQGLDLAHFRRSGTGFVQFWAFRDWIWHIFVVQSQLHICRGSD